jgi:hypothetical protein
MKLRNAQHVRKGIVLPTKTFMTIEKTYIIAYTIRQQDSSWISMVYIVTVLSVASQPHPMI